MIVPFFYYQGFKKRGDDYVNSDIGSFLQLVTEQFAPFYRANNVDSYFAGIDTLLHMPEAEITHQFGGGWQIFKNSGSTSYDDENLSGRLRPYRCSRCYGHSRSWMKQRWHCWKRKSKQQLHLMTSPICCTSIIHVPFMEQRFRWRISIWGPFETMIINYRQFCRCLYTMDVPSDCTIRRIPAFSPPLQCFGKSASSLGVDYRAEYTKESALVEYESYITLRDNPKSTIGLLRQAFSALKTIRIHANDALCVLLTFVGRMVRIQ